MALIKSDVESLKQGAGKDLAAMTLDRYLDRIAANRGAKPCHGVVDDFRKW